MKGLLFIGLILAMSCSKVDNSSSKGQRSNEPSTSDIKFSAVQLDTLTLKKLVMANDKLLDIFKVELKNKQKSEKINGIIQSDSNRQRIYNLCEFKIKADKRCDEYRHLLISKERNQNGYDLKPYKGLYLIIIDPNDNVVLTERLKETSLTIGMTSMTDETNWSLNADSLLTINSESTFCSDVIIDGEGMTCWTDKIQKQFKLSCSGLNLITRDSTRTEGVE